MTDTRQSRERRLLLALILGALGVFAGSTSDALAISAPIHIANTGGEGVNIRAEATVNSAKIGHIPEGTSPDYNCFVWGERINGVPIWFNVNYGGVTGFYASYFDDSSYHSNDELTAKYGVPLCGSPPSQTPPPEPTAPPNSGGGGLVFTVYNAEDGIYYRNSPHWSDTSQTPGVGVYNGDQVELICGAFGDAVGPYSNTAWSYVKNLSRSVGDGWVNEHYINDGVLSNQFPRGEPMCGSGVPGASGSGSSGNGAGNTGSTAVEPSLPPSPPGVSFNRSAAVSWAVTHAEDTPPYHSACTWFVSQALWAGGLPQSSTWNGHDHHRSSVRNLQGTVTAWTTPLFITYIKQKFPHSTLTPLDLRRGHTNVPAAQPGDVILYDWDGKSSPTNWAGLDHAALVIDDARGSQYPEVAEWGADDFLWWGGAVKYKKRGWTWSQVSHKWLQEKKPSAQAFLLHIDTTS